MKSERHHAFVPCTITPCFCTMYYCFCTGTIKNTFSVLGTLHDWMLYFLKKIADDDAKIVIRTVPAERLPLRFPSRIFGLHSNRTEDKNLLRFPQTEPQPYQNIVNRFCFNVFFIFVFPPARLLEQCMVEKKRIWRQAREASRTLRA